MSPTDKAFRLRVQLDLFEPPRFDYWERVGKFDRAAALLADRHYSRRKPGSPQFMPPGQTIILRADRAVFGWWRPHPASGLEAMNGLDGWTCTIFRNEGPVLSSSLILDAERAITECGPDGLLTYVWDKRVSSPNPGYCFKMAGWRAAGRSADGRKTLLQKRFNGTPRGRAFTGSSPGRLVPYDRPANGGDDER